MAFDDESFVPAIFVEDNEVILPSTSNPNMDNAVRSEDVCATAALASVFGNESRLFQPITAGTFIEEVVVDKPPKVVNVGSFNIVDYIIWTIFKRLGLSFWSNTRRGILQ